MLKEEIPFCLEMCLLSILFNLQKEKEFLIKRHYDLTFSVSHSRRLRILQHLVEAVRIRGKPSGVKREPLKNRIFLLVARRAPIEKSGGFETPLEPPESRRRDNRENDNLRRRGRRILLIIIFFNRRSTDELGYRIASPRR